GEVRPPRAHPAAHPNSVAHPYVHLYGVKASEACILATVTGNVRVTEVGKEYDTHHIVLDFGSMPFPVLEGQSIGVIPPGEDRQGKAHHASGRFEGGKLMLFFGARTKQELPYFGPLQSLPKDFIDIELALSRTPGQAKRYVQDAMRDRAADLARMLQDPNCYFYVCGLKAMEEGVVLALRDIAGQAGLSWDLLGASLKREGRLHLETY
ncbi:MAG: hypothetical protein EBW88_02635, partial [Betaproteobacteria bacterium]|nr:hypothetical protein [Betaproteobacteria bacterium]